MKAKFIKEDIGAPMATLTNVPGMGNAQPASTATMTGSQQCSHNAIGSGDKWSNNIGTYQQNGKIKKKKKVYKKNKKTNEQFYPSLIEDSISPHDKLGVAMAKKMRVPIYFKKGKNQSTHQKVVSK